LYLRIKVKSCKGSDSSPIAGVDAISEGGLLLLAPVSVCASTTLSNTHRNGRQPASVIISINNIFELFPDARVRIVLIS
jgi:hypothetical protein